MPSVFRDPVERGGLGGKIGFMETKTVEKQKKAEIMISKRKNFPHCFLFIGEAERFDGRGRLYYNHGAVRFLFFKNRLPDETKSSGTLSYIMNRSRKEAFSMKRFLWILLTAALLTAPFSGAQAGWYPLTVATEGRGIAVYTASNGSQQAGLLYNGFNSSLSLSPTNGLYSCNLTTEYTVWLNDSKAMKALPKGWDLGSINDEALEARMPCGLFLAEVVKQDAPLYTTPGHKHQSARHAPGTLMLVCGEFGDDYYVTLDGWSLSGFTPKSALKKVKDLTYAQATSDAWGVDGASVRTVYTGGGVILRSGSATGYSDDCSDWRLRDGDQVTVLKMAGGWAQLVGGGFIEARFLDPLGDHSRVYATVISDKALDRLNVRSYASKDASVVCKLCAGAKVQVANHTDEWASVFVTGKTGGVLYTGAVMMQFLDFGGDSGKNGCTRVRTRYDLGAGNGGDWYRMSWQKTDGVLPAGTELTVIGVEGRYNADSDDPDRFLCLTADGRLITLLDDGVLDVISSFGLQAKASSSVRMRSAPSTSAGVEATLAQGTKVEVLLRGEGWTMVQYKGQTGYIMSRYLNFP